MIDLPTDENPVAIIHGDCLDILPQIPAGAVDAVVTDPPYGLEWSGTGYKKQPKLNHVAAKTWDKKPDKFLLQQIKSISKSAIIWGGNYLADELGSFVAPLIWDKMTGSNTFADGELAWTSFKTGTMRIFRHQWCGAFKDSERGQVNYHPTQKPVALMRWCIQRLPKNADIILDPFAGSGTTGVAAVLEGRKCILIEKDARYVEVIRKRIKHALCESPTQLPFKHPTLLEV